MIKRLMSSVLLMWCLGMQHAYALTTAGTLISNQGTVTYEVNGNVLSTASTDTFVVDYMVDLVIANNNGGDTSVVSGQSQASITFELKNEGNKDESFTFMLDENVPGDSFNPVANSCRVFDASNNDITAGVSVPQEASALLEVRCDMPSGLNTGDLGKIIITADSGETNSPGSDEKDSENIVLADSTGVTDSDHDGKFSAEGAYKAVNTEVAFEKHSCVLSDPVHGTSPQAEVVSGAVMVYVLDIHNSSVQQAEDVVVSDTLSSLLNAATVTNARLEMNVPSACNCLNGQGNTVTGTGSALVNTGTGANAVFSVGTIASNARACLSFEVTVQ